MCHYCSYVLLQALFLLVLNILYRLAGTNMTGVGATALASALKVNTSLEELK